MPCEVELATQTNATLLTPEFLDLFAEHDLRIGISIDGDQQANDVHRRFRNGKSSFTRLIEGISLVNYLFLCLPFTKLTKLMPSDFMRTT